MRRLASGASPSNRGRGSNPRFRTILKTKHLARSADIAICGRRASPVGKNVGTFSESICTYGDRGA